MMRRRCPTCGETFTQQVAKCGICDSATVEYEVKYLGPGPGAWKDLNPSATEFFQVD